MQMKRIGKVKIGREKIHERIYPRLRLPTELSDWIDKKAFVYVADMDGKEVIILSRDELAITEGKGNQLASTSQQVSQIASMEQRISRLERTIEELTKAIEKIQTGRGCDSGFDARSCAGVAEPGQRRETQDLLP